MNQEYFQKWAEIAKNVQKPLQAILELNMKTLQALSYLKPEDVSSIKKPEELIEKQMTIAIENGHKSLDYFKKTFEILEKSLFTLNDAVKESTDTLSKKSNNPWLPITSLNKKTTMPDMPLMDSSVMGIGVATSALDSANPVMDAARSVMESNPLMPDNLDKPLFDHSLDTKESTKKKLDASQSALNKTKPFEGKRSKKNGQHELPLKTKK